jgi:hypothetical protein
VRSRASRRRSERRRARRERESPTRVWCEVPGRPERRGLALGRARRRRGRREGRPFVGLLFRARARILAHRGQSVPAWVRGHVRRILGSSADEPEVSSSGRCRMAQLRASEGRERCAPAWHAWIRRRSRDRGLVVVARVRRASMCASATSRRFPVSSCRARRNTQTLNGLGYWTIRVVQGTGLVRSHDRPGAAPGPEPREARRRRAPRSSPKKRVPDGRIEPPDERGTRGGRNSAPVRMSRWSNPSGIHRGAANTWICSRVTWSSGRTCTPRTFRPASPRAREGRPAEKSQQHSLRLIVCGVRGQNSIGADARRSRRELIAGESRSAPRSTPSLPRA